MPIENQIILNSDGQIRKIGVRKELKKAEGLRPN
jgi:hypothetical protein